ncbi:MAG: glycosyltransferase [Campylobacteraceae bacterium]
MKVVQLLPELNEGGVERGVVELNREFVKQNIESTVISSGGKLAPQIEKDGGLHVNFDVCSKNPFTFFFRAYKLRKILKDLKPDILHVRSRVPAWLVHFANKSLHVKIVSTVHGFNSVGRYSKIMQEADSVICVSMAVKEYIVKNYKTDSKKITVIPRGVDLDVFNEDNLDFEFIKKFKKEHNLENSFIISSVGRITQLKDYETFIEAFSLLTKEISNAKALIVGGVREDKKEYFETLKDKVKVLGLESKIKFCGSISKIAEIYSLSDVVVSSSKKPEAFGRSVAEAIALNTPVVASNHGGVLDIICEGINGHFTPVQNPQKLKEAILKASELEFDGFSYIKKNFSLKQMVEKTIEVYKKVLI